MFKKSDVSAATGLLISGYLRDAGGNDLDPLRDVLDAIKAEIEDWEENFEKDSRTEESVGGEI
jgi:hypothetical protein